MPGIIYGRRPVLEALEAGEPLSEILVAEGAALRDALGQIVHQARQAGVPVKHVPRPALERVIQEERGRGGPINHQGVVARVADYAYADLNEILAIGLRRHEPAFILALDAVQDVHNLGNLLRTAEAVGVHGALLAERGAAGVTAAVRKASAGAVAHLAIARVDLPAALDLLRGRGIRVVGLHEGAEIDFNDPAADLGGPLALVVGSEGRGVSAAVRRRCDALVRLPMRGKVGSLNAGVAGSVVLYEVVRRMAARSSTAVRDVLD